jgi:hypothetical protein
MSSRGSKRLTILAALVTSSLVQCFAQSGATAIGHEYRQDDSPSIATAPDGSLWATWLSFDGARDDVAIRRNVQGKWENLQWVPGTSGDNWLPQIGVDASNRVWVVWSQQVNGNWDLYARSFDPAKQRWGALERLTSDPAPDINPRLAVDARHHFALVWQGFRGKNSNIFLKTFDGDKWSADIRITNRAANDWEPAVAIDSKGTAWVAYDSYKNGNYDVYLSSVAAAQTRPSAEIVVAASPDFEARATVAVDSSDRVWVAYENGPQNWGKDQGYVMEGHARGAPLGGAREARIRCYEGGRWREPAQSLASLYGGRKGERAGLPGEAVWQEAAVAPYTGTNSFQPHVFSDGQGSVWVISKILVVSPASAKRTIYWEYRASHFNGREWSTPVAMPDSEGRSSTRVSAVAAGDRSLWVAWPTDGRSSPYYHRPRRQRVLAQRLPAPELAGSFSWKTGSDTEAAAIGPTHLDEAGDLRAIQSFAATIGGKPHHILRGDFHRHTELSWDAAGGLDGDLDDFYRYMIDAAAMDFGANTDHQGGWWPYWWWYSVKMTDMYNVPGAYAAIFGYERSVVYPFGHRNVFFANRAEARVTPFHMRQGAAGFSLPVGPLGDDPGVSTGDVVPDDTKLLYEDIRPRNGLAVAHTPATGQGTNWSDNDPNLEPVVEIFQGARLNSEQEKAPLAYEPGKKDPMYNNVGGVHTDGFVSNAWDKGYKLGIIASSDHFSTHISYAMVYTADSSRQGILDAIRKRHTYGAMDNIVMEVRLGEHFMGDEFSLRKAEPLRVRLRGTRKIASVVVIKDGKVIYSIQPGQQNVQFEFRDSGSVEGRHYYYVRAAQDDDTLAWSSPMFVNYR